MSARRLPTIALVQMDVAAGRPDLNLATIRRFIDSARRAKADIIAFPELCLTGYIIGDLWEVDTLVRDFASYSDDVRALSDGLTVIFGNVAVDEKFVAEDGRLRKYNAVFVCTNGEYVVRSGLPAQLPHGIHVKTLHPNYRFFDDDRHFYSLRTLAQATGSDLYDWCKPYDIKLQGEDEVFRFGVQLCEDMWCDDYVYDADVLDTLHQYHKRGAQAVINLSSSPWTWQKNDKRNRVVRDILSRSPMPFFYVNHVGAQNNGKNIILFDGDSAVYSPEGSITLRAPQWSESLLLTNSTEPPAEAQSEIEAVYHAILTGLRHMNSIRDGECRFLVGASGGIDSSVVTCLLTRAFGPECVFAVNMPTRFNAEVTRENARVLCERLEVDYLSCPVEDLYEQVSKRIRELEFPSSAGIYDRLIDENIQARIRSSDILAGIAAKHGLMFTNNGNKTELALGYCTLYGDVGGAIAPIADLYKGQVYDLGQYLNDEVFNSEVIPANLLSRETVPSAELSEEQDVTRGLGDPIKYGYHDAVLRQLIEYRHDIADLVQWRLQGELLDRLGWREPDAFERYFPEESSWIEDLEWVERQLRISFFKRIQAPPIIVLSKRAFGFDLRETQRPAYRPRLYEELKARLLERDNR